MRYKLLYGALSLAVLAIQNQASAQNDKANLLGQINTITTAVPFLMISPDARAGGMGDAGVASSADVNSIHWNPAKLVFADKRWVLEFLILLGCVN